jgi:hypothetical protein
MRTLQLLDAFGWTVNCRGFGDRQTLMFSNSTTDNCTIRGDSRLLSK